MSLPRLLLPFVFAAALAPAQAPDTLTAATTFATAPEALDEECSVGVAAGRATADGRPLLWKNRDAKHRDNVVRAFDDGRFPYVALCNAGPTKSIWGGANAAGFCIMNSVSRDLASGSEEGPSNGPFMKLALQRCATVDEFETLLRETDESGRRTRANFGVIDGRGRGAIFETAHRTHVRFDAEDSTDGIVVRTNFATTADGNGGRERFARASTLCFERPARQQFDHHYLLQRFCRDLAAPPSAEVGAAGMQDVRETIHRQTTVSAMVFHGVRNGEDPRYTTMWAVLGQPLFSLAVPCWPAAEAVARVVSGTPRSALCDASIALQRVFYEEPSADALRQASKKDQVAIRWLRTDDLPRLLRELLPAEDRILDATRRRLELWRAEATPPDADAMLAFHRGQVDVALRAASVLNERFASSGPVRIVGDLAGPAGVDVQWTLAVNGVEHAFDTSSFDLTVPRSVHYALRVDVPGHFPSLHSFAEPDVVIGTLQVPTIQVLARKPGRVLLAFGGDTMLGRRYERPRDGEPTLVHPASAPDDAREVLRWVKPYLELADIASVNLETQVFEEPPEDATPKSVTFFSRPTLLSALHHSGVDYVALGNNHTYDFGQPGLERTLEHLRAAPLAFSGAGLDEVAARRPATLTIDGTSIVLRSYVGWRGTFRPHQAAEGSKGGAALGSLGNLGQDLRGGNGDIDVFQFHSGFEYANAPSLRVETAVKTAIDLGADVAIGHHPHVLQGFELHRGKLIAYSMGNFLFDQYIYGTQFGMLLFVCLDGDQLVRAEAVPIYLQGYVPTPATGVQRDAVLRRLVALTDSDRLELSRSGAHLVITPREATAPRTATTPVEVGGGDIVDLRELVQPDGTIVAVHAAGRVRLGVEAWNRGDFENHSLYGSEERGWLAGPGIGITAEGGNHHLRVATRPEVPSQIGMRTFMRQFTRSADVTLRFRARATGPVTVDVFLQRRRERTGLGEALSDGPRTHLGELSIESRDWSVHRVDFAWPRVPTLGVRVIAEVRGARQAALDIDDWELVEWRSPPLEPDARVTPRAPYTHLQRIDTTTGPVVLFVDSGAAAHDE